MVTESQPRTLRYNFIHWRVQFSVIFLLGCLFICSLGNSILLEQVFCLVAAPLPHSEYLVALLLAQNDILNDLLGS